MSKSLTLSMSLALALGFSGVSFAGHGTAGCDTCGLASPQGVAASPQGYTETCDTCTVKKTHCFSLPKLSWPSCLTPKPKMYTYEWVLKKKRVWGHSAPACDTCGTLNYVEPHGMTAACPKCKADTEHSNIPYALRDRSGCYMVRRWARVN